MNNDERIKCILSPVTRQSIATMLMNFVSTIPDDEEVEISFNHTEEDGESHIFLDAVRTSRTPDIEKKVILTKKNLDVCVSKGGNGKVRTVADKRAT